MYAVIEASGAQHRVEEGEILRLDKMETPTGESILFDKVLAVGEGAGIKLGEPYVDGSTVSAEVLSHGRDKKIRVVKFHRRKYYRRETGHRQWFTEVKITGINAG